jgi:multiple sugar transport system ATP-binding protein
MKITLERVTKRFGDLVAVDDLSLEIEDGEIVSILGPSGCGKTTTLNMVAGFENPTEGSVYFDGRNVGGVHPRDRNVGMVFQEYAIFTTMNAFDNIGFGLRVRRTPKKLIREEVLRIAQSFNLQDALYRNVNKLNLSELQRVALARTLTIKPGVLLLDEPLSNLDAALREKTRVELKRFHDRLGITMAYVTHDQIEAISLADRIAVMRAGRLQQFGTAEAIYERPANIFVAQFIGSPPANLVKGRLRKSEGRYMFERGTFSLDLTPHREVIDRTLKGDEIAVGFRPEDVGVSMGAGRSGLVSAEIYAVEPLGDETIIDLKIADVIVRALVSSEFSVRVGETASMSVPVEKVNLFDVGTEKNLFLS